MRNNASPAGGANTLPRVSDPDEIFPPSVPGWEVSFHASLDSTNLEAKRLVFRGASEKRLIIAESQSNGQCRHDRLWESPPEKGLWASFIMPVSVPFECLPQSTLVLAVAVRDGIREATDVSLLAKWPNDLLGNGRKCCGLLVETAALPRADAIPLILGAGINCGHGVADFPPYLRETATSLSLLADGARFSRTAILRAVARNIDHWFAVWETQGFDPVRAAWLGGNCTVGKTVLLPEGYGFPQGTAQGIDPTGALTVRTDDGSIVLVNSGEILFAKN